MTNRKISDEEVTQVRIAANTFMAVVERMEGLPASAIADGLLTVFYSIVAVSFKDDQKEFNKFADSMAKTLKARFKEGQKDVKTD